MEKYNWSEFKKRISISAEKEAIFNHWSSQELLENWFLSSANFWTNNDEVRSENAKISAGDSYKWVWHGSDNVGEGEVLETNDVDFLRFTFLGCEVSVTILEEDGENVIELIQSQISLDETSIMNNYVGCTRGWTFYLTNLKSILEGGIDLRNKNKNLLDVINT